MDEATHTADVSVVMPAFNAGSTIAEALDSVREQTLIPAELVVIDDVSIDGTVEAVTAWLRGNSYQGPWPDSSVSRAAGQASAGQGPSGGCATARFRRPQGPPDVMLIRQPRNGGPAAARNCGMAGAAGEWIAFLDADDAWLPWRLEAQFEVLRHAPETLLVCGGFALYDAPGAARIAQPGDLARRVRAVELKEFVDGNPVATTTVLVRKQVAISVGGFDEQFRGPEDMDLWVRVAAAGKVLALDAPLARYRERPGSLSMDPDRFLPQVVRVYDKAFGKGGALRPLRHLRRQAIASRYTSAAWTYLACGRRWKALARLAWSWVILPGRLKVEQQHPLWRLILLGKIFLNLK